MKTILITGATGFVGIPTVRLLRGMGDIVHAPGRSAVNLLDEAEVSALIAQARPTHLLHLAWITTPGVYWTIPLTRSTPVLSSVFAVITVTEAGTSTSLSVWRRAVTVIFSALVTSSAVCAKAGVKGVAMAAIELARIVLVMRIVSLPMTCVLLNQWVAPLVYSCTS